jgi:hypothetical protein
VWCPCHIVTSSGCSPSRQHNQHYSPVAISEKQLCYGSLGLGPSLLACQSLPLLLLLLLLLLLVQGTPMYRCLFDVRGPQLSYITPTDVAPYLAAVVSASGPQFCSSAPIVPNFCGGVAAITGYCAAAPAAAAVFTAQGVGTTAVSQQQQLTCTLLPLPGPIAMSATLAAQGSSCNRSRVLTTEEADSLVKYMGIYVPGFKLTLRAPNAPMTCSKANV